MGGSPCRSDDSTCFHFPTTGVRVAGRAMLLAIDEASLPLRKDLCYYLSRPEVRPEAMLRPGEGPGSCDNYMAAFPGTVLYDEGKFRMWYSAAHLGRNPDWPAELAALGGRTVRLRIRVARRAHAEPRLYAIYLEAP